MKNTLQNRYYKKEFHLGGNLLIIYFKATEELTLIRIGIHSQLFK
jgi:mRNA interferase YafQ